MAAADMTYVNLEGPVAPGLLADGRFVGDPGFTFDNRVYSTFPQVNFHPQLIDALLQSGVDVVSTGNNHALDRHAAGADRTIENLDAKGLAHTGTLHTTVGNNPNAWATLVERNGVKVAWISCGFSNITDKKHQVLHCSRDSAQVLALIGHFKNLAQAVIVTPHWGSEYQTVPNRDQVCLGHQFLEAGALAVLGTHPHVLQPMEKHVTRDGRETVIAYSLGNLITGQYQAPRRATVLLFLDLVPTVGERLAIQSVRLLPAYMDNAGAPGQITLTPFVRQPSVGKGRAEWLALTRVFHPAHLMVPPSGSADAMAASGSTQRAIMMQ
jgi:poly-gamma-glutamate synthesis protein (capsule biosynthesis protein)